MLRWTPSSGAANYQVFRDGAAYSEIFNSTQLWFDNNKNITAGQTYQYLVRATNAAGFQDSPTETKTVPSDVCPIDQPSARTMPYPIIFIHGINSDDETWGESIANLKSVYGWDDPYSDTPIYSNGRGIFHALLNASDQATDYKIDVQTKFTNEDNKLYNGNVYAINFRNWWNPITKELKPRQNREFLPEYNFSESNESAITKQAYALSLMIHNVITTTGKSKVILVGHSMGGLAAREYLQRKDRDGKPKWWAYPQEPNGHRVAKLLTIGTPHAGSNMTEFGGAIFIRVNSKSEAARDLTYNYFASGEPNFSENPDHGIFIFDGPESIIPISNWPDRSSGFLNRDVDCDGNEDSFIAGINSYHTVRWDNPEMQLPPEVDYTWVVSDEGILNGDGAVRKDRQYLDSKGDTLFIHRLHQNETGDYQAIIRGLDEPDIPNLAYSCDVGTTFKGFAMLQSKKNGDDWTIDYDWYKFRYNGGQIWIDFSPIDGVSGRIDFYPETPQSNSDSRFFISFNGSQPVGLSPQGALSVGTEYYFRIKHQNIDSDDWQNPYGVTVRRESGPADNYPVVAAFKVEPTSVMLGKSFKISYTVSDDIGLDRVELWRANDVNGAPVWPQNPIQTLPLSGQTQSNFFTDAPADTGTYWYGIHVVDTNEKVSYEPDPPGPSKVTVTNSPSGKILVVSPDAPMEFGTIMTNTQNEKTITLQSMGTIPLRVTSLVIGGANADQFSVISPTSTSFSIANNAAQDVTLRFRPTLTDSKSATLTINNDSNNAPTKTIALSGSGTTLPIKTLVVRPDSPVDFESVMINNSREKNLILQNTGTAALKVTDLTITGTSAGNFALVDPPSTPFEISAVSTKPVTLRFRPIAAGVATVLLHISHDAENAGPTKVIYLTGTGTAEPSKTLAVDPEPSFDFGNVTLNIANEKIFTLANIGTTTLSVSNLAFSGIDAEHFSIDGTAGIIHAGDSKLVTVRFRPTSVGSKNAALNISNDADNARPVKIINLAGNGVQLPDDPFTEIATALTGVRASAVAWGDYDDDNDLDILLTGMTSPPGRITRLYKNNEGIFNEVPTSLPGVMNSSVDWGDFDSDGDLDILLTGLTTSTRIAKIYKNEGIAFVEFPISLPGVESGEGKWGDYDNDGDLDILLAGNTGSGYIAKIYQNAVESFLEIPAALPGVRGPSAAWGDYDNDGDLDILLTGDTKADIISKIYQNNEGRFEETTDVLTGVEGGSVAWGDYNNDGDLDIFLTGSTSTGKFSAVYTNEGGRFKENALAGIVAATSSAAEWGDYDNDGDLDILLTGSVGDRRIVSTVFRNNGGVFEMIYTSLPEVSDGSLAWGDYNNDGDLDILLTGLLVSGSAVTKIYQNNIGAANQFPTSPTNLTASVTGDSVTLNWSRSTDSQTAQKALSYNLRVGTTPDSVQIVSPMAHPFTGYRKIPKLGNTNHDTTWTIKNLHPGTYYWSVQAIDNAFAGSAFAPEHTFTIVNNHIISLPDTNAYGNIRDGDRTHANEVRYSFTGQAVDMLLSFQAFDVDRKDEIIVLLNDTQMMNVPITLNNEWSGNLSLLLSGSLINDDGVNTLIFRHTKNPPQSWIWGVRRVEVSVLNCVELPASEAYGKIVDGDQGHADKMIYCFPAEKGDLRLTYEVYDIDKAYELDVLLNGIKIHDEAITDSANWSERRSILLPDSLVDDNGKNSLIFDNTMNPPKGWFWGIRNVEIARITAVLAEENNLPRGFELEQNSPNPFNPATTIRFKVPHASKVKLTIFDARGGLVRTLTDGKFSAGQHAVVFDASRFASGIYFYRLETGNFVATRKMILAK